MLEAFERELPLHDAVLFSDYGKGGLTHITRMIESARAAGKPVLVDPKGTDYERYAGASVITPNRGELAQVVGALAAGLDAREAMPHANRAGGIVVGKFGTASASYAELFGWAEGLTFSATA